MEMNLNTLYEVIENFYQASDYLIYEIGRNDITEEVMEKADKCIDTMYVALHQAVWLTECIDVEYPEEIVYSLQQMYEISVGEYKEKLRLQGTKL